jgi:chromosomal replication initiation ATPase DnaA
MIAETVLRRAEATFGVPAAEIQSRSRETRAVRARQAVAYALRWHGWGVEAVGVALDRDHSTVSYAAGQAERRAVRDPRYALQLAELLGR